MTNLPHGLSSKDLDYIEGRHYDDVEGLTDADRDELRGQDWMRSLGRAEHTAIPVAIDRWGHGFQALCQCGPVGDPHRGMNAKAHAIWDANEHNHALNRRPE